jgi:myo-inositol-1(or 4)-monophosphatase
VSEVPVDCPTEFVDFAKVLARKSGDVIRPYFGRPDLRVDTKEDASPVTDADRRAEELMRTMIIDRYPEHGIVGEEFGSERPNAEWTWTLDPIDGTISFAAGCPLFGTLISVQHRGIPVLGVIHNPILGQLCVGTEAGTTLNGKPTRVRETRSLADAVLLATDVENVAAYRKDVAAVGFAELRLGARLFRTWGDCFGYLLLVSGGADVMLDPIMNSWDLQPLIPIVRGAGGVITSWYGEDPLGADSCVASGPMLHAGVVETLNGR